MIYEEDRKMPLPSTHGTSSKKRQVVIADSQDIAFGSTRGGEFIAQGCSVHGKMLQPRQRGARHGKRFGGANC